MRRRPAPEPSRFRGARSLGARRFTILLLSAVALVAVAPLQSCKRNARSHSAERKEDSRTSRSADTASEAETKPKQSRPTRRIMAAWYPVPPQSLAKRRAPQEFTAAHNTLPLGTRVRVTNPDNDRSLVVRITDRGIHDRRVKLDVCKEAAEELGIVREGFADLKMEVLPEEEQGEAIPGAQTLASGADHFTKSE